MDIYLERDGTTYEVPQDVLMRFRNQVKGLNGMTIDRDKRLEMVASCDGNEQRLLQLYVFLRYEHDMKPVQLSEVSCRIVISAQRFNIFLHRMKETRLRGEPRPQRVYSLSR
jgi:hypothetical protein